MKRQHFAISELRDGAADEYEVKDDKDEVSCTSQRCELQLYDNDEAELVGKVTNSSMLDLEYHVILSPVYQVPVLYFMLRGPTLSTRMRLEQIVELIVPREWQHPVADGGILGALSCSVRASMTS